MKTIKIAYFGKHFGEEPPLVGDKNQGSGAIFFSGCNLRCVFCQNFQISQEGLGKNYSVGELAKMMIKLQDDGAVNINLVTPTIWQRQIKEAIILAKSRGLTLPIAWNSNGYENILLLQEMEGLIDIYLPDFKYGDDEAGYKYSGVKNYSAAAVNATKEMFRQVGHLKIGQDGIAQKGLIVRHLILPNNTENSISALHMLASIDNNIHLSLMRQYFPLHNAKAFSELMRSVNEDEFKKIYNFAEELGFKNGWVQEEACECAFVPDFTKDKPFG
ncbi:MAG: radical SAM protein [bacterium]